MTAPVRPDTTATGGMLHRILTPDEFHQAQQLPPESLAQNPFPLLPPAAPADATRRLNPNAGAADKSLLQQADEATGYSALTERAGAAVRNSTVGQMQYDGTPLGAARKAAGALTRQVAAPIIEHPLLAAATALGATAGAALSPAVAAAAFLGPSGKNVVEWLLQRQAENSLPEDVKAEIANDAEYQSQRVSGESAAVDAATLGLAGAGAVGARVLSGKSAIPSIVEATQPVREQLADFIAPGLAAERRSLARTANTDALTGLGNQRAFKDALPAAEQDPNTSVIRFDANGFKAVNDAHGHDVGDEVLSRIGDTIREQAKDLPVFRTGGDEFAVFAPAEKAEGVRDAIEKAVGFKSIAGENGAETPYSISGGVGNTNAEADQAAIARKAEHKAAQGIPDRAGEQVASALPAPKGDPMQQAFADWNSGRAYLGNDGNYRIKGTQVGPDGVVLPPEQRVRATVAPWNKEVKSAFPDNTDFHKAARAGQVSAAMPSGPATAASTELQSAVTQHVADVTGALGTIAPADQMAAILRAKLGDVAGNYEQAAFKVDEFRRAIDWLPENDKLGFWDAAEGGRSQPVQEFQPLADHMRQGLDSRRDRIQALGTGKLETYIENYMPRSGAWADPDQAETTFRNLVGARRPLEGTKSFLKQRTHATLMDGLNAGLQLRDGWNPIDQYLTSVRDMDKYIAAHEAMQEGVGQGVVKYFPSSEPLPDNYGQINDRIATVYGKPTITINEAFDAQQRAGIQRAIDGLGGVEVKRSTSLGRHPGLMSEALGYAKGDSEIGAKFGSHDGVLMHELGHIVDNRFGMGDELAKAPDGPAELAKLADLRYESNPKATSEFRAYVHQPEEQAANALHAYLHAPELMKEAAPNIYKALDQFLLDNPKLAGIRDIKPSLELQSGTAEQPVGGMVIRGRYAALKGADTIINNHLSPGLPQVLRDTWGPRWGEAAAHAFELYRGLGNTLNQAQLGFSGFHLGTASVATAVSRMALGLEEAVDGNFGRAAKNIVTSPIAPASSLAQGLIADYVNKIAGTDFNWGLGAKIRQAYLDPTKAASPEMLALAQAVKEGGGRLTQDSFYKTSGAQQFMSNLRQAIHATGEGHAKDAFAASLRAGRFALPAALEMAASPIMNHVVPLMKLQVFGEMAQKAFRDLPPDATLTDRRLAIQSAWESVDNRLGQLVYDNLHWNRTFKDLAMASTRSVGWNVGTIRELGGGTVDIAKGAASIARGDAESAQLTHRAAFAVSLPIFAGLMGATYQYLRTGEGPSELKDYFHPKTGELDADGNAERVQMPSYMKDVMSYTDSPFQTLMHKVGPLPTALFEMLNNQDFYGDEIRNPNDPLVKQFQQEAEFIGKTALPFTVTNSLEQNKRGDQSAVTKWGNLVGVTPAPRRVVRSDAQNMMNDLLATKGPAGATPEEAEHNQAVGSFVSALRGHGEIDADALQEALSSGKMVPADIGRAMKRAGLTPAQEKFKRLSLNDALQVFDKASDREKALFADALSKKLSHLAQR